MPVYRWRPVTEKQRVVDKFGGEVGKAVEKLKERGFIKFRIEEIRGKKKQWEIEATRFDKEEI